jgi:hypothetical protein
MFFRLVRPAMQRSAGRCFAWPGRHATDVIFIPAGSVEGVKEVQGKHPNWARSYFPHTIYHLSPQSIFRPGEVRIAYQFCDMRQKLTFLTYKQIIFKNVIL